MSSKDLHTETLDLETGAALDYDDCGSYVQESLFDIGPDEELGYRVPIACQVAGITYRQLDYWARTDLVKPSIRTARGSGSQRLYSFKDVLVLKIVKRLLDTGISLQNIRLAVESLRDRGVNDLAELTLVSDGTTVYECRSNDEVIDLLAGGQGVFGIAVPGILKELSGTITSFPAERIVEEDETDVVVGLDELAARRKRKSS
ncbi:transcriptional regulator, MerR family [Corynebacterium minutissimum]|uniref:Transcriptional regulator, MerR family n=1 Tax=Corynebacterium minutissimum TaxID=38301 RepID=A0A2X4RCF7_9CORY|nr:MerR family transcriptional regulator [Corynebacterium minutissimum]SQH99916.1 transcriptional regulator, MerR family [Corynebacterium minutissimum]VEG06017.1 transcriptional regulator, MerR family [Corynebacterium minutissimum]